MLVQPEGRRGPPLRALTDAEVAEFLWSGQGSIGRRAVQALVARAESQARLALCHTQLPAAPDDADGAAVADAVALPRKRAAAGVLAPALRLVVPLAPEEAAAHASTSDLAAKVAATIEGNLVVSGDEARLALRRLAAGIRLAGDSQAAAHDVLTLYAHTHVYLAPAFYEGSTAQLADVRGGVRLGVGATGAAPGGWHHSTWAVGREGRQARQESPADCPTSALVLCSHCELEITIPVNPPVVNKNKNPMANNIGLPACTCTSQASLPVPPCCPAGEQGRHLRPQLPGRPAVSLVLRGPGGPAGAGGAAVQPGAPRLCDPP